VLWRNKYDLIWFEISYVYRLSVSHTTYFFTEWLSRQEVEYSLAEVCFFFFKFFSFPVLYFFLDEIIFSDPFQKNNCKCYPLFSDFFKNFWYFTITSENISYQPEDLKLWSKNVFKAITILNLHYTLISRDYDF